MLTRFGEFDPERRFARAGTAALGRARNPRAGWLFALAAAVVSIAAALSLAGGASAQLQPPQDIPNSSMRYIGISSSTSITDAALTSGAASARGYTNVLKGPEWASGTRYLFFAVPDSEHDIAKVRRTGSFADSNYLTISRITGTRTLGATSFKVWRTSTAQAQSFSGLEFAIEQVSFASGCRTIATATLPATGDSSLPVCPDNDASARLQPIDAEVALEAAVRYDPQLLTIWTSGPDRRPRWIRDYITNVYDPDNPGRILDPRDLSNYESVEGRGRYITGSGERNDLFIGLRKPGTDERYTYGELTGVRVHVSPDNYYVQNFHGALYSRPSKGPNDALGNRRLDLIDHPNLLGKKICNPLHIPYGANGYYVFGDPPDPDNPPTPGSGPDDVPFTYYTATTPVCVIDRAEWKLLSGTPNASNSDLVPDLHLQFSIPDQWSDEDNRVWVGVAYLTENGTCTNAERDAATCDTAVSTWYETLPEAFIYRINSLGDRCPIYQPVQSSQLHADDVAINDAYWQEECELASVTDDPFTGGEPIRIGFTLLDSADFDADPALTGRQAHRNILRWSAFDSVSIRAEASILTPTQTDPNNYVSAESGQFRFIRRDGTKSDWKQSWLLNRDSLRYETYGSGFLADSDPKWFDAFPVIEYIPTHEATAQLQVHFFNHGVELNDASGFVMADDLPDPRPKVRYLPDGRIGVYASGGVIPEDTSTTPPTPRIFTGYATYGSLHPDNAIAISFTSGSVGTVAAGSQTCTASADSDLCDLAYSRQEAWEAAGGEGAVLADALVRPIPLLFFPGPATDAQTMAVTVFNAEEGMDAGGIGTLTRDEDHEGKLFVPNPAPAFSYAGIAGALELDSDGIASPGDEVALTIGFQINAGDSADASTEICTFGSAESCTIKVDPDGSYLRITGPAAWEDGSDHLAIDGSDDGYKLACSPTREIFEDGEFGAICYVVESDGETRPKLVVDSDAEGDVTVHAGFAPGGSGTFYAFTRESDDDPWRAARLLQRQFGSYTLKVQQIEQLDSIALARAPVDGAVPTGPVFVDTPATVRLSLLNENGQASHAGAVASISVTATLGKLSHPKYCPTPAATCNVNMAEFLKAAAADGDEPAEIDLTLKANGKEGTARVRATVIAKAGAAVPTHRAGPLAIIFSGAASALTIGNGTPILYNQATAAEGDDRDKISISAMAANAAGVAASLPPSVRATLTGPDGANTSAGIAVQPNAACGSGAAADVAKCKYEITVTATSDRPLATGVWMLSLEATGIDPVRTPFIVAGPADNIEIEIGDPPRIGETIEASITVTDAPEDGNPVADGTPVAIVLDGPGRRDAQLSLISTSNGAKTAGGDMTAKLVVIGRGITTITATAGNASDIAVVDTSEVATGAEPASPAAELGSTQPASFTTYQGSGTTSASALLEDLDGPSALFFWNGIRWLRYAVIDGRPIPGSLNFEVQRSDILWIGGS